MAVPLILIVMVSLLRELQIYPLPYQDQDNPLFFSIEIIPRLVNHSWPLMPWGISFTNLETEKDRSNLTLLTGKVKAQCIKFQSVEKLSFKGFSLSKNFTSSCNVHWAIRSSTWRFSLSIEYWSARYCKHFHLRNLEMMGGKQLHKREYFFGSSNLCLNSEYFVKYRDIERSFTVGFCVLNPF